MLEYKIAEITIRSVTDYVPYVLKFIQEISLYLGLDENDVQRFKIVLEEVCLEAIENSEQENTDENIVISLYRRPESIVVIIEDANEHIDYRIAENEQNYEYGFTLLQEFSEMISVTDIIPKGRRISIYKKLPFRYLFDEERESQRKSVSKTTGTDTFDFDGKIRALTPAETKQFSKFLYAKSEYLFTDDFLYAPDLLHTLIRTKQVAINAAFVDETNIIGALVLKYTQYGEALVELCNVFVDMHYRNKGLFKQMFSNTIEDLDEEGFYGIIAFAPTNNMFLQKSFLGQGGKEIGLYLQRYPFGMETDDYSDLKLASEREMYVLYYFRINNEPPRIVYPPQRHKEMIFDIYKRLNLQREAGGHTEQRELTEPTLTQIQIVPKYSEATFTILQYGVDCKEIIRRKLHELLSKNFRTLFLDLPLSDPLTSTVSIHFEKYGFVFCSVIPEGKNGDILRYQFVNPDYPLKKHPVIVSDFGKRLFKYIKDSLE